MNDNKYAMVEGMLYSYKNFPYVIRKLELKYKLEKDEKILDEIEIEKTKLALIDNMLDFLKMNDINGYYIIYYRYIERLEWKIVVGKLVNHNIIICENAAKDKRRLIINKYLIGML